MSIPDHLEETQPVPTSLPGEGWPLDAYQPIRVTRPPQAKRRRPLVRGCLTFLLAGIILLAIYLLLPIRTNILILGTDSRDPNDPTGRTDTIILTTIVPLRPDVGMLSVPRDLWVNVTGVGEQRINTAYILAEINEAGSGAQNAKDTIHQNFGVKMNYYALIQFEGISTIVDAIGGVDVQIPTPMSGYQAGTVHMDGAQALAFVRDRATSDDFFRMERGQIFITSLWKQLLQPNQWNKLPALIGSTSAVLQTDVPIWLYPKLGFALLRAGPDGIDNRVITRDEVNPFTTSGGAQVLGPNWAAIDPIVQELFGVTPKR
ncbi:MAG: LCP family protein [Anaerolineae bacterium]|nr:LCP family protein [Anaerolineae bacterium]